MLHPPASLLHISRNVARITKFYRHIDTDLPYICTRYDVSNYFRSEAIMKKIVENSASDSFRWNFSLTLSK